MSWLSVAMALSLLGILGGRGSGAWLRQCGIGDSIARSGRRRRHPDRMGRSEENVELPREVACRIAVASPWRRSSGGSHSAIPLFPSAASSGASRVWPWRSAGDAPAPAARSGDQAHRALLDEEDLVDELLRMGETRMLGAAQRGEDPDETRGEDRGDAFEGLGEQQQAPSADQRPREGDEFLRLSAEATIGSSCRRDRFRFRMRNSFSRPLWRRIGSLLFGTIRSPSRLCRSYYWYRPAVLYRFREGMTRKGDSQGGVLVIHRGAWFRGGVSHASLADPDGYQRARTSTPCQAREKPASGAAPAGDRDRKSTRLNSSHTVISYAVFCLKKKKYIR